MNKMELAYTVRDKTGMPLNKCCEAIESILSTVKQALSEHEDVHINRFGKFKVRHKSERPGLNPKTLERVNVSARSIPVFSPGKYMKKIISGESNEAT